MTGYQLNTRPNEYGCHDPQCLDSTWDHECPVLPPGQPEVAPTTFSGIGVDLSPLDGNTAHRLGMLVAQMIESAVRADREQRKQEERFVTRSQVLTWDWKEWAPMDDIGRAIEEVSDDQVHLYQVDTGSDQVAILISNGILDETQVAEIYHDYLGD